MPRVLYLSHTFAVGGAEEMVLNLVRHLPPRFEPMVTSIGQAGPIGEEIRRTGVPFAELGLTPGMRRPLDVLRLERHLRDRQPTIVHTFLLTASLYGRAAAILASVPIVIGTEVNIYERKRAHHAVTERLLMAGTDAVVASAESVKEFYTQQVGADPAKVEVIYNAVDWSRLETTTTRAALRASMGVPPDARVAGIIARLTEQKGHRVLFDAMAGNEALRHLHLVVVGGGELEADLRARVADLRAHRPRALRRAAPRSRRSARLVGSLRHVFVLGRSAVVAGPGHGRRPARRLHSGRREFPRSFTTTRRGCSSSPATAWRLERRSPAS